MRIILVLMLASWCSSLPAAERRFDFASLPVDKAPPGFRSTVTGEGKPGDWRVVLDDVPPLLAPLTPQAPIVTRRAVVGQFATDRTDEHFPMLVFEGETFGDFKLTTGFKIVSGKAEQMAGIAFRLLDEKNYYVIRASTLGRNVRFYKVVNGVRSAPIGPEVDIAPGVWQELLIEAKGTEIRATLNGREIIPPLTDTSFKAGKIAFWTKSDSVSYFTDTRIQYTPKVALAQAIVQAMMNKYPRIIDLKIYQFDAQTQTGRVIASKNETDLGQPGGKYEQAAIETGEKFYAKTKDHMAMVMPLRDRNGDAVAAVRVHLTTFSGQTEQNALIRVTPIVKEIQARVQASNEPLK